MILLANHDKKFNCSVRNHGYCRIAHLLLKLLGDEDRVNLIEVIAKTSGKTALHLAVATGHPCQLRVLLALTGFFIFKILNIWHSNFKNLISMKFN